MQIWPLQILRYRNQYQPSSPAARPIRLGRAIRYPAPSQSRVELLVFCFHTPALPPSGVASTALRASLCVCSDLTPFRGYLQLLKNDHPVYRRTPLLVPLLVTVATAAGRRPDSPTSNCVGVSCSFLVHISPLSSPSQSRYNTVCECHGKHCTPTTNALIYSLGIPYLYLSLVVVSKKASTL